MIERLLAPEEAKSSPGEDRSQRFRAFSRRVFF